MPATIAERVGVEQLWRRYQERPDLAARNALVEYYLPWVRRLAAGMSNRLPKLVDVEDLVSAGVMGLMQELERFDPGRGVKFESFAALRVLGAMGDWLRESDWAPRLARRRSARVGRIRRQLEQDLGRTPSESEVLRGVRRPGESGEIRRRVMEDARRLGGAGNGMISLSRKVYETDGGRDVRCVELLEDRSAGDGGPARDVDGRDMMEKLTRGMSADERLLIRIVYGEGMTMKEAGRAIGVSESRISQMHASIIARMKAVVAASAAGN